MARFGARAPPPETAADMSLPFLEPGAGPDDVAALAERARRASDLLKALSHETRLLILCILAHGERSVSELETMLALPQAAVSQQLARLRIDNLVITRRDGRMIYYALAEGEVTELVAALYALFCARPGTGAASARPTDGVVAPEDPFL
jgi:DNA-binding transcriptional ArsR family regulator